MRLLTALRYDFKFQFRHGFYYAYAIVSFLYIILLNFLPDKMRQFIGVLIVFSDPAVLGFFFIGGIMLLERRSNILEGLFITPLRIHEYIISRVISLSGLALLTSHIIMSFSFSDYNIVLFSAGILLTSLLFTLLGIVIGTRVETINGYILLSPLISFVFFLPVLAYLGIFETPFFYFLPGKGCLLLISSAFSEISFSSILYSLSSLLLWIIIFYNLARKWLYKYVILKIGG